MIKVGILNAESPDAGELIRLLINHPETDIITLHSKTLMGRTVASAHHGLIGERIVNFTDKIEPENLDIIFITENNETSKGIIDNRENWSELRIIDITSDNEQAFTKGLLPIGLSEINRKNLVREATIAFVPSPVLVLPLISLVPLAQYMLLNSPLHITLSAPEDIVKESRKEASMSKYIEFAINHFQPSFSSELTFSLEISNSEQRVLSMHVIFDCPLSLNEVEKIYESAYDDHNFTFVTHYPVSIKEVEGTQKCIISLQKPSAGQLEITAIADGRMRGGAGDAVHMMNLFKGLHEKVGLQLKSSAYFSPKSSESSSWFA